eukprot:908943-Pyramimonas_sp.AAC.1
MKITRCRLCDERGHWGDECPNPDRKKEGPQRRPRNDRRQGLSAYTFTGCAMTEELTTEILDELTDARKELDSGDFLVAGPTQGL